MQSHRRSAPRPHCARAAQGRCTVRAPPGRSRARAFSRAQRCDRAGPVRCPRHTPFPPARQRLTRPPRTPRRQRRYRRPCCRAGDAVATRLRRFSGRRHESDSRAWRSTHRLGACPAGVRRRARSTRQGKWRERKGPVASQTYSLLLPLERPQGAAKRGQGEHEERTRFEPDYRRLADADCGIAQHGPSNANIDPRRTANVRPSTARTSGCPRRLKVLTRSRTAVESVMVMRRAGCAETEARRRSSLGRQAENRRCDRRR